MMGKISVVCMVALFGLSPLVVADMMSVLPVDDGYVQEQGGDGDSDFDTVVTNSTIYLENESIPPTSDYETRGVLEFDISLIPAGSTVATAELVLVTGPLGGVGPELSLYGYTGNGTVDLGDAVAGGLLVPPSPFTPSAVPGATNRVAVPAGFLQSLVDARDRYTGFTLRIRVGRRMEFASLEVGIAPVLHVEYTVVPNVSITGIDAQNGNIVLQWEGNRTNLLYMVECCTSLPAAAWSPVTPTSQWWMSGTAWTNIGPARRREFFRAKAKEQ